ncbi:MAG TPA: DUF2721 domain-containing protein [Steroidobacteraceae bacterium]
MTTSTPTTDQLSNVIAHATAPAFLLGALSGFIAILITRLNWIIDQPVLLQAVQENDPAGHALEEPNAAPQAPRRLDQRGDLMGCGQQHRTALLLIVAFLIAFFALPHEYGVAIPFVIALGTFTVSLTRFAQEVRIAVMDFEHLQ